jgi:hypothetical protein
MRSCVPRYDEGAVERRPIFIWRVLRRILRGRSRLTNLVPLPFDSGSPRAAKDVTGWAIFAKVGSLDVGHVSLRSQFFSAHSGSDVCLRTMRD